MKEKKEKKEWIELKNRERRETKRKKSGEERKKKERKERVTSGREKVYLTWQDQWVSQCVFNYQNVIGNWVLEIEKWKHLKCVFSFHNSSLKNQRI